MEAEPRTGRRGVIQAPVQPDRWPAHGYKDLEALLSRLARDVMLGLSKTCRKLRLSYFAYLGIALA